MQDVTLSLPSNEQGRFVRHQYENDVYFLKNLLNGNEGLCAAIRALGPVKKLNLGWTEAREVAERIAREMGVEELSLTWHRTYYKTAEEDLQWVRNGWMLDPTFLRAYKGLRASL